MKFVTYNQWKQLPTSADQLFREAEKQSFSLSRSWLENISEHALAEGYSTALFCVVANDRFLAILPMMHTPQGSLCSLTSCFTSLYSILVTEVAPRDAIFACLAEGLVRLKAQPIQLDPIDMTDENMIHLQAAMQSCGFQGYPYFRFYNWSHPVNGQSFNEYMATRPANLRNTIKRKQRKIEREHDIAFCLYTDTNIDQALHDYQVVYQASWKANEFFNEFTPALVGQFSKLGWLRLAILSADKQAIAAQIWFVVNGKASIYRLAHDKKWNQYSPGSLLTQYLMREVIDQDKVYEIDFLTGNERYKQDWMTIHRKRFGIRYAKPSLNKFQQTIQFFKELRLDTSNAKK
jgi:hypothetical protein